MGAVAAAVVHMGADRGDTVVVVRAVGLVAVPGTVKAVQGMAVADPLEAFVVQGKEAAVQGTAIPIHRADLEAPAAEDVHSLAEPMRGRVKTAEAVGNKAPPVTEFDKADIVELVSYRTEARDSPVDRDPTCCGFCWEWKKSSNCPRGEEGPFFMEGQTRERQQQNKQEGQGEGTKCCRNEKQEEELNHGREAYRSLIGRWGSWICLVWLIRRLLLLLLRRLFCPR